MSFVAESDTAATTQIVPFEIWEVMLDDDSTIKFHIPLLSTPTWMPDDPEEWDEKEYLQVVCPELEIGVCAERWTAESPKIKKAEQESPSHRNKL